MLQEGWFQSVLAIHVSAGISANPEVHVPVHSSGIRSGGSTSIGIGIPGAMLWGIRICW
jgi:hypothetical protein